MYKELLVWCIWSEGAGWLVADLQEDRGSFFGSLFGFLFFLLFSFICVIFLPFFIHCHFVL
jgi:hypothetical protein